MTLAREFEPPTLHIDVLDVFQQRMLIKPPIDSKNAMREDVVLVGSSHCSVAHLFTEFSEILGENALAIYRSDIAHFDQQAF
jgi:hypothetical protein